MIEHVNDVVCPDLKDIDTEAGAVLAAEGETTDNGRSAAKATAAAKAKVVREVFQDAKNYTKSGAQMLVKS